MMVSMAVLVLLIALISLLFNGAVAVIGLGSKHIDTDTQARAVFDRMAIDFGQMVKRSDVDYFVKIGSNGGNVLPQTGSDQIAFYSQVAGYYPTAAPTPTTAQKSPVSLVGYRINSDSASASYNKMERLGIGLVWNGVSLPAATAVVFLPIPLASPLPSPLPSPMPVPSPTPAWPQAGNMAPDPNYELTGPQVFRMEYYYVLKGTSTTNPSILSDTPWDTRAPLSHTSVNGMQDVAAIAVVIAVVDPKSRVLASDVQLAALAGAMNDFSPTSTPNPGDLEAQWQTAITSSALPRLAASAIRVYRRTFYLPSNPALNP